jgi:hypothetical protein
MLERVRAAPKPPPKRGRPRSARVAALENAIVALLKVDHPMTVRQIYYQMEVRGLVGKDTTGEGQVARACRRVREDGRVPLDWIHDKGRGIQLTNTHSHIDNAVEEAAEHFRLSALKEIAKEHVQVWVEKNALASLMWDVCFDYDVPLIPCGGAPSWSLIWDAANDIVASHKEKTVVYIFSDYDPTGFITIPETIEEKLSEYVREIARNKVFYEPEITFKRPALNREQVDRLGLPTRPTKTKKEGNMHAERFLDPESSELDALTTSQLQDMVRQCLRRHVSDAALKRLRTREQRDVTDMLERMR